MTQGCTYMKRSKGQTFTTDFMASIVIFGFMLTIFLTLWSFAIDSQDELTREEILDNQATRTIAIMTTTNGYPEDWHEEDYDLYIPGFATTQNTLSEQKIQQFAEKSYDRQTSVLRVPEFQITFDNEDLEDLEAGREPVNASLVIPQQREVTVVDESGDQTSATMRYMIWS